MEYKDMRKIAISLITLVCAASFALAGDSEVTNSVTLRTPFGSERLRDAVKTSIDDIITWLDAVAHSSTELDGEQIADDTIPDDAMDFTDVTLDDFSGSLDFDGSFDPAVVVVGDVTAYTNLAANSGKVHLVPDLTADCTITLPAEAEKLNYTYVYVGGAADAQHWTIDTGNDANYFVGGLGQADADDTNSIIQSIYSDGDSNSKLGVLTPAAGTVVNLYCEDGTNWYVWGQVFSATDTGITFSDQ
jgi:hypothetical protein